MLQLICLKREHQLTGKSKLAKKKNTKNHQRTAFSLTIHSQIQI